MIKREWIAIVCVAVGASVVQARECCEHGHAHDRQAPYLEAHLCVRIHADRIYSADNQTGKHTELKSSTHLELEFRMTDSLSLFSTLLLEEKHGHHDEGDPGERAKNRYFRDHVLGIEELKLVYEVGAVELFGGKFNPTTGIDAHVMPGYYGYEAIEELEIAGRLGAGAAYTFDTGRFGAHRLEASAFCRDTTVLNQTLINSSEEPRSRSGGGVANTHDLTSWAVALSGDAWVGAIGDTIHQVDYVAAYARQSKPDRGDADDADEKRVVGGAVYTATLTPDLQFRGVGQVQWIRNDHAHGGDNLRVSTIGAGLNYRGWELGGSLTEIDANTEPDGHHRQISLGYNWENGLGVAVGWKKMNEHGDRASSVGLMVSYHAHF